jgi:hypothetical protein
MLSLFIICIKKARIAGKSNRRIFSDIQVADVTMIEKLKVVLYLAASRRRKD